MADIVWSTERVHLTQAACCPILTALGYVSVTQRGTQCNTLRVTIECFILYS